MTGARDDLNLNARLEKIERKLVLLQRAIFVSAISSSHYMTPTEQGLKDIYRALQEIDDPSLAPSED